MNSIHTIAIAVLVASGALASDSLAAAPYAARPATFTAPFAHPTSPTLNDYAAAPPTFRWGWFGAQHYPAPPVLHRDYNRGWKEWHYRR